MKVFFDSNVYIAEALLGKAAARIVEATRQAHWRIYTSKYLVDEVGHVLVDELRFSRKLANLTQRRIIQRASLAKSTVAAEVPHDPKDSPILQAALTCGADYLVTNDRHLLEMNPFKGLQIISMGAYHHLLEIHGLLE